MGRAQVGDPARVDWRGAERVEAAVHKGDGAGRRFAVGFRLRNWVIEVLCAVFREICHSERVTVCMPWLQSRDLRWRCCRPCYAGEYAWLIREERIIEEIGAYQVIYLHGRLVGRGLVERWL